MTTSDPLLLRCLALTGTFETGKLPPACFGSVTGDFDGQGISFSALQWNFGQKTLQPMLQKMFAKHSEVIVKCFAGFSNYLQSILYLIPSEQLAWSRTVQNTATHQLRNEWVSCFALLGATVEWQNIAMASAQHYFDSGIAQAKQLGVSSDRALALMFDTAVQNGGVRSLPLHHCLDTFSSMPSWGEPEKLRCIATAVADSANPKWREDVLARKLTIANGVGRVHGLNFDLAKDFAL